MRIEAFDAFDHITLFSSFGVLRTTTLLYDNLNNNKQQNNTESFIRLDG